jgi:hypothetical protein
MAAHPRTSCHELLVQTCERAAALVRSATADNYHLALSEKYPHRVERVLTSAVTCCVYQQRAQERKDVRLTAFWSRLVEKA